MRIPFIVTAGVSSDVNTLQIIVRRAAVRSELRRETERTDEGRGIGRKDGGNATKGGSLTAFVQLSFQQLGHGRRVFATFHVMLHDISTKQVSDRELLVQYGIMTQEAETARGYHTLATDTATA